VFGDDDETVREILTDFIEPATSNIDEIVAAREGRNISDVEAGAHKLKSSARSVGANDLADLCDRIEAAARANEWESIDNSAGSLQVTFDAVAEYVQGLQE
jgi:HPt (histidine-containing phosphotransfer) domain-containing protein